MGKKVGSGRELLLRGRLRTSDLLVKIACFVKSKHSFSNKSSGSELVCTRRSTILILPPYLGFPGSSVASNIGLRWKYLLVTKQLT